MTGRHQHDGSSRRERIAVVLTTTLLTCAPAVGVAQSPTPAGSAQAPVRDTPATAPQPAGTAIIRGRVVRADNGHPLRDARITVDTRVPAQLTDSSGRFELTGLQSGRHVLSISKVGYVAKPSGAAGAPSRDTMLTVDVAAGQLVDRGDIPLERGGVIAGRVIDPFPFVVQPRAGEEAPHASNHGGEDLGQVRGGRHGRGVEA
jgi:hypothetical protein